LQYLTPAETREKLEQYEVDFNPPREYHCDIYIKNVVGADLRRANFNGLKIKGSFAGANLQYSSFFVSRLMGVNFTDADLSYSIFNKSGFYSAYFYKTKCYKANFTECKFDHVLFPQAYLREAVFDKSIFIQSSVGGKGKWGGDRRDIRRAYYKTGRILFKDIDISGGSFKHANIVGMLIENCNCANANFFHANIERTTFFNTNLDGANFNRCILYKTKAVALHKTRLVGEQTKKAKSDDLSDKAKKENNLKEIKMNKGKSNIWTEIGKDYDVSKRGFGKKINFVTDRFKRSIIFRDVEHAYVLASYGFSKPAVILAGSIVEELLRIYLGHKHIRPSSNTFESYLNACKDNNLLKSAIHRLSDSVRHFRNIVHLENESSQRYTISKSTAKGAVASIFTIANDF